MLAVTSILTRSTDADAINAVINAPEVRPFVGGEGVLDITPALLLPNNVALMGEHGGFLFAWSAPGVYEVHTFILLGGRGEWARAAASHAIESMARIGASMLWTRIAPEQENVIAFALEMGMRPTGETVDSFGRDYPTYKMELI